jgi:RNA polymerase sigma factor (sigma-70 family)
MIIATDAARSDSHARATQLLREHAGILHRVALSYARSEAEREDLLQDIALGLWTALPHFRGECSERSFLFRIAHNRALSFLARRGAATEDIEDHQVRATSGKNPAIAFERQERSKQLLLAVQALPCRSNKC